MNEALEAMKMSSGGVKRENGMSEKVNSFEYRRALNLRHKLPTLHTDAHSRDSTSIVWEGGG